MSALREMIVNADDLGMDESVNDATFAALDAGLVTSATILANGEGFADAVRRVRDYPHVSFGVHLNATEFLPLRDDPRLLPLLDGDGRFDRKFFSTPMNRDLATALLLEWEAQVRRVRQTGVTVTHLDSHHLVHTTWRALPILKELQRRTRIPRIRTIKNLVPDMHTPRRRLGNLKRLAWRQRVQWGYPAHMVEGMAEFAIVWDLHERGKLPFSRVEAMVHPAHPRYADETEQLRAVGPGFDGVRTISYHDV